MNYFSSQLNKFYSYNPRLEREKHLLVPIVLIIILFIVIIFRAPQLFSSNGIGGAIIVVTPLILASLALTPIALVGRGGVDLSVGPLIGFINVSLVAWLVGNGFTSPFLVVSYVLGAGILSGGNPKDFKSMRKAGASFFYDQQKKFKRIYDLINASKPN